MKEGFMSYTDLIIFSKIKYKKYHYLIDLSQKYLAY